MDQWTIGGDARCGPVFATAIHNGHALRPELERLTALDDAARLREEDPLTQRWASLGDLYIVANRSRFEVDLNRVPEEAVYRRPEDAWGLELWQGELPAAAVRRSMDEYRAFYAMLATLLDDINAARERVLVLDFHAYNHRRNGPHEPPEPQQDNPDINVGTHEMNLRRWGFLVDAFIERLASCEVNGRPLDVRRNVKFVGRALPRWVDAHYPDACALAIEVKKTYMDEWTGEPDHAIIKQFDNAFRATIQSMKDLLE